MRPGRGGRGRVGVGRLLLSVLGHRAAPRVRWRGQRERSLQVARHLSRLRSTRDPALSSGVGACRGCRGTAPAGRAGADRRPGATRASRAGRAPRRRSTSWPWRSRVRAISWLLRRLPSAEPHVRTMRAWVRRRRARLTSVTNDVTRFQCSKLSSPSIRLRKNEPDCRKRPPKVPGRSHSACSAASAPRLAPMMVGFPTVRYAVSSRRQHVLGQRFGVVGVRGIPGVAWPRAQQGHPHGGHTAGEVRVVQHLEQVRPTGVLRPVVDQEQRQRLVATGAVRGDEGEVDLPHRCARDDDPGATHGDQPTARCVHRLTGGPSTSWTCRG